MLKIAVRGFLSPILATQPLINGSLFLGISRLPLILLSALKSVFIPLVFLPSFNPYKL